MSETIAERIERLATQCRKRNLQFDIYTTYSGCPGDLLFSAYLGVEMDDHDISWSDVVKGNSLKEIITQLEEVYVNLTTAPFTDQNHR